MLSCKSLSRKRSCNFFSKSEDTYFWSSNCKPYINSVFDFICIAYFIFIEDKKIPQWPVYEGRGTDIEIVCTQPELRNSWETSTLKHTTFITLSEKKMKIEPIFTKICHFEISGQNFSVWGPFNWFYPCDIM